MIRVREIIQVALTLVLCILIVLSAISGLIGLAVWGMGMAFEQWPYQSAAVVVAFVVAFGLGGYVAVWALGFINRLFHRTPDPVIIDAPAQPIKRLAAPDISSRLFRTSRTGQLVGFPELETLRLIELAASDVGRGKLSPSRDAVKQRYGLTRNDQADAILIALEDMSVITQSAGAGGRRSPAPRDGRADG